MLVMDRALREEDRISKYHITQPAFSIGDVAKVKVAMKNDTKLVAFTSHCEERIKEKRIHTHSLYTILGEHTSRVFEIKLVDGALYRFAVRVSTEGSLFDTTYVIQPRYFNGGYILTIITVYKNNRDDLHFTLDGKNYC